MLQMRLTKIGLIAVFCMVTWAADAEPEKSQRPNVLMIIVDDLNDWMNKEDRIRTAAIADLACVHFVDAQVGKVLKALEDSPYADNTIVILTSDHGYHLGEKHRWAKHSLWERATRVLRNTDTSSTSTAPRNSTIGTGTLTNRPICVIQKSNLNSSPW